MKKKLRTIVITLAAVAAAAACKSEYEILLSSNDVDAKYNAAMELFNNRKYLKAGQLFESMAILTDGTERDDTVRYYWALSNYRYKDYYTAESNLAKFIEKYPTSPFTEDARFLRLDCLYRATYRWELDQTPTRNCLAYITVSKSEMKYSLEDNSNVYFMAFSLASQVNVLTLSKTSPSPGVNKWKSPKSPVMVSMLISMFSSGVILGVVVFTQPVKPNNKAINKNLFFITYNLSLEKTTAVELGISIVNWLLIDFSIT